ncbi:MAG: UDP-N-acetylmuramoyl-tripeptide--D-alanyl-D-alanine ligase [Firmicutes bacterium]|nr:UDP-N-acetylmuramoyl-tripeptide--D-alanyl-D-alanine ligase [Bacillota bacterium]MCL2255741.1 UDP-N-acetylmuramoyl-tripeptide--D-alanyl-D-alanine ligase [Bacillota bacterium]
MHLGFIIPFTIIMSVLLTICGIKLFQIYQLNSYRHKGVWHWFKETKFDFPIRYFALALLSLILCMVFFFAFPYSNIGNWYYAGGVFFVAFCVVFCIVQFKKKQKKPLKITPRVLRTLIVSLFWNAGTVFGLLMLGDVLGQGYYISAISALFIPANVALSFLILYPFERLNHMRYIKSAKQKLSVNQNLIKIGITGSYGKTSAKDILTIFLSKKFKTLKTPASFNTPLGIAKTINDNLTPDIEVLVAEMGARFHGDIAALCKIVEPKYAILTAIANQHLDTMKTLDGIFKTKYELIASLPNDGFAVFLEGSDRLQKAYEKCHTDKIIIQSENARVENERVTSDGTVFDMVIDDEMVSITTKLLGKHIPSMLLMCAAMAKKLGVSLEDIKNACEELEPTPHRLELIKAPHMTIIDNAYNSNPEGAKRALEVLASFEGLKVIITPGFVELGQDMEIAHIELGKDIAKHADIAILVGSSGETIKEGILKAIEEGNGDVSFSEKNINLVASLDEAMEYLKQIDGEKKTVLFENDLPDNYK